MESITVTVTKHLVKLTRINEDNYTEEDKGRVGEWNREIPVPDKTPESKQKAIEIAVRDFANINMYNETYAKEKGQSTFHRLILSKI